MRAVAAACILNLYLELVAAGRVGVRAVGVIISIVESGVRPGAFHYVVPNSGIYYRRCSHELVFRR